MLTRVRLRWSGLGLADRRELLLAALLLFAFGFFQQRTAWNETSRYDLVRALVLERTTRIDSFHENTGDKALYQGHWYSDKAPGTALLGVPVYAVLLVTARLGGQDVPGDANAMQALAFMESGIPTMLLVILLIRFLAPYVGERWAYAVGLAYAFGSIAFPFATMFFGHAASTAALFGAFYLLHQRRLDPSRQTAVAAGFLAGWAVLIEIPVALGAAVLLVYALFINRRVAGWFIAGGIPLAAVLLTYNWLTFGSPFSIGYQYTPAFASQNAQGLVSVVWPELDTALSLLFSERGLLRLAPWFALAPLGLVALRRRDVRFEILLAAVICAAFLTYNSGALNPFGGWTPGPRYLLPALPFAALLVAFVPERVRIVAVALMLIAAVLLFVATVTMPNAPERFADPLGQLWLPRFGSGQLAESAAWMRWGIHGFAVLAVLLVGSGIGLAALALSFSRSEVAGRTIGRAIALIAAFVLAFSMPLLPQTAVALGWPGAQGRPEVSIVELGGTTITVNGVDEVELWARIENHGGAIPATRAEFTVLRPTSEGVWAAYYGAVPIDAASRQTITITWHPADDVPAGTYRFGFEVKDPTTGASYAAARAPGAVTFSR